MHGLDCGCHLNVFVATLVTWQNSCDAPTAVNLYVINSATVFYWMHMLILVLIVGFMYGKCIFFSTALFAFNIFLLA